MRRSSRWLQTAILTGVASRILFCGMDSSAAPSSSATSRPELVLQIGHNAMVTSVAFSLSSQSENVRFRPKRLCPPG